MIQFRHLAATLLALSACTIATPAFAQAAGGGESPAEVTILRALQLVKARDLDFGTIVVGTQGGTVVINPGGAQASATPRTTTGDVVAAGGTPVAASFALVGRPTLLVLASVRESQIQLTRVGGSEQMRVRNFRLNQSLLLLAGGDGSAVLRVGGTLTVGAQQVPGTYRGTFTITAAYL